MTREEPQPDGTVLVWRPRTVSLFAADGTLLEWRMQTDAERAAFQTWQESQPGGERIRAVREAREAMRAAFEAAEAARDVQLAAVRTIPDLITALRTRRTT